jgi:hypothetical protein
MCVRACVHTHTHKVQLKSKLQHTWTWWAAAWLPAVCYRPAVLTRHFRNTAFILARKNSARLSNMVSFQLSFSAAYDWKCVTWNCVKSGVSVRTDSSPGTLEHTSTTWKTGGWGEDIHSERNRSAKGIYWNITSKTSDIRKDSNTHTNWALRPLTAVTILTRKDNWNRDFLLPVNTNIDHSNMQVQSVLLPDNTPHTVMCIQ